MSDTNIFPMSAWCAALMLFSCTVQATVSPSMEVHAIVERGDGKPTELRVADGGVLRSGDRLQVRVRAPQDGYIYVIAYGTSGSALLLHPFSGRTETARVRADEEMIVPAEGVYLPLDARPGREVLFAIWSKEPLRGVSSLLVRMEGTAGDSERAEQMLRDAYPQAQRVAFRHLDSKPLFGVDLVSTGMAQQYRATGTIAPLQERAASQQPVDPYAITSSPTAEPVGATLEGLSVVAPAPVIQPSGAAAVAEPDLELLLLEQAPEENVLGGVGSRLRAFETGQGVAPAEQPAPAIAEPAKLAPGPTQIIGPGAPPPAPGSTSEIVPQPSSSSSEAAPASSSSASSSGLTAAIAALFGGGDASPRTRDESPTARTGDGAGAGDEQAASSARVLPLAAGAPASASSPILQLQVPPATTASESVDPRQSDDSATPPIMAGAEAVVDEPAPIAAPASASGRTQAPDPSELGVALRPAAVGQPPDSGPVATVGTQPSGLARQSASSSSVPAPSAVVDARPTDSAVATPSTGEGASSGVFGALSSLFSPDANPDTGSSPAAPSVASAGAAPSASRSVAPAPSVLRAASVDAPAVEPPAASMGSRTTVTSSSTSATEITVPSPQAAASGADVADDSGTPASVQSTDTATDAGLFGALAGFLEPSTQRPVSGGRNRDAGIGVNDAPAVSSARPPPGVVPAPSDAPAAATVAGSEPAAVAISSRTVVAASSETQTTSTATADTAAPKASSARASSAAVTAPASRAPQTAADAGSSSADGGLFSALGALFAPAPDRSPAGQTDAASDRIATSARRRDGAPDFTAPVPVPASPAEAPTSVAMAETSEAPPAVTDADDGGVLGSLGRLFGVDETPSSASTATPAPAASSRASVAPATALEPPRPALNIEEGVVVRLDGPASPPPTPPQPVAGTVLGNEGNRIRALLGETQPQPSAPAAVATATTSSPEPVEASAAASVAPAAPAAPPVANRVPTVAAQVAPAPRTVAATPTMATEPAPTLTASVSQPAPSVSVAPPLPGLAAGGSTVAAVPQLATMNTAQSIESARRVARGVVMVVTPEGSGSGALVDGAGHVLTNWHLVGGYSAVTVLVKSANGDLPMREQPIRARVVRYSKFADLALLKLDTVPESAAPLVLGDASVLREGSMLHAIGHPDSNGWSHTPIIVTRVREQGSWYSGQSFLYKAAVVSGQAHADPGANGSALFDARMQLVALGASATRRGDKVQAVSVDTIRSFLQGGAGAASVASGG